MTFQSSHGSEPVLSQDDPAVVSLKDAPNGSRFRVVELRCEPSACQRLREMGFCEDAEIAKVSDHGPLVCKVCGTRVALSSSLADGIMGEKLPHHPSTRR